MDNTRIFHSVHHQTHGLYYTTQWAVLSTLALYFGVAPARTGMMGFIGGSDKVYRCCTRTHGDDGDFL